MGNPIMPPRHRKLWTKADDKPVDYGVLKSLIRDEVDLQVKRQIKTLIQPLYQVIMSDPKWQSQMTSLPQWARELLDSEIGENIDPDILNNTDEDLWR